MLRSFSSLCLFCQVTSAIRPQWHQIRTYAQAQRKRPSRMVLSNRVGRSGPPSGRSRRNSDPLPSIDTPVAEQRLSRDRRGTETSTLDRGSRRPGFRQSEEFKTMTPRKERRVQYYKDLQEREQWSGDGPKAFTPQRGPPRVSTTEKKWESPRGLQSSRRLEAPPAPTRKRRGEDGGFKRTSDRPAPGPFGSLNQRTARLPPTRGKSFTQRPEQSSRRDASKSKGRDDKRSGDFHSLKMQQALATVSYESRNRIKEKIDEVEGFEDFPLLPSIKEALSADVFKGLTSFVPTPIQRLAIPEILGGSRRRGRAADADAGERQELLLAAETGSGKTLAYLLPAIDAMKRAEQEHKLITEGRATRKQEEADAKGDMFELDAPEEIAVSDISRPKVIVLVPTAELVEQVGTTAKLLSHKVKFRTAFISSNYSQTVIKNRLFMNADVLVSTPHLLASISDSEPLILSEVTHLVIDEADSLLDRSFSPTTSKIIDKSTPTLKKLVLCSATIPKRLDNYLRDEFPNTKRLTTPNLHAIPRRVQLGVVDVEKDPYRGNKDLACADVIWKIGTSAAEHSADEGAEKIATKRLIVFVNEREKSVELAEYLTTKGIDAAALNRDLDTRNQTDLLAQFCLDKPGKNDKAQASGQPSRSKVQRTLPNTKVLVCTDIASRGIDTTAVRHVVLYDVPHTSIDFIHRLGRTGRMGRRGRGVVLVGKKDRKDVVREIREAMFKGAALI